MYTEDDKDVTVKKSNSKEDYNDFYTSFNEMDNEEDKKSSKKKSTRRKIEPEVKEEADFSNFYGSNEEENNEPRNNINYGKWIKLGVVVILVILLILLIIFLINRDGGKRNVGDIELTNTNMSLKVGDSDFISYKIVNTNSEVISTFTSSNENVAIVDENGGIKAIGPGEATITIKYTIDGETKEKTCKVKVTGESTGNHDITLNVTFDNGSNNSWTNKDVTISVSANSDYGITSIKYAVNCEDSNCNYKEMSGNKLTISNEGTTKITLLATDKKNQEAKKEAIIKIDKTAPTVTYSGSSNIVSNKTVEVCATCSDSVSGCTNNKVCKKYTSSASNQVITVSDNAGNKKSSSSFNVTINKVKQPCELKVSSDGTVTATLREEAVYYGFNSSYSGNNETTRKVEISGSKKGDSGAKVVYYYVKNKNGTGGRCNIVVIKECDCTDKNSTSANCPVTCTYRSN